MLIPGQNIAQLTGLRGLAALIVVFHHAANQAGVEWYLSAHSMVDIFFVLSGFVMGYVYLSKGLVDWQSFAIARFARIYPLHAATAILMAASMVGYAVLSGKPWPAYVNAEQALREATLMMAMPIFGADQLWNFPAWSISVEWWVYFTLFPILALYGHRLSNKVALAIFVIASIALALCLHADIGRSTRYWPAFFRALVGFGGGWLAYRIATTTNLKMTSLQTDIIFAIILIAICASTPAFGKEAWFLIPFYPMLVFALATTDSGSSRVLASRPAEWLGNISFSIYLVHPIVLKILDVVAAKITAINSPALLITLAVSGSIVAGGISYNFYEKPARKLFRKRPAYAQTPASPV